MSCLDTALRPCRAVLYPFVHSFEVVKNQLDSNINITDPVWKWCSFQRLMATKDPIWMHHASPWRPQPLS